MERKWASLPALAMAAGLVVLGVAAWTALRDDDEATVQIAPDETCRFPACRAAENPEPARGYEGPSVAINPADRANLVVADANMILAQCAWHTSTDGGQEWTDGLFPLPEDYNGCRINGASGGHVPMGNTVWGPSGAVYTVLGSAHRDDAERESVMVARSADGGMSWSVSVAARPPEGLGYARPLVGVAPGPSGADTVMVTFWECDTQDNVCQTARFARSDDGGASFGDPVQLHDEIASQNPSAPLMDDQGRILATYQQRFTDEAVDFHLAVSTDGGASFDSILIDRQPGVGGEAGHDPVKLARNPASGHLYIAYTDSRTGTQQVVFQRSTDGGETWSLAIGLRPLSGEGQSGVSRNTNLSMAPDGRIDVAYYRMLPDDRDHVFWSYSHDGGSNFFTQQVTDRTQGVDRNVGYGEEIGTWYPPGLASAADSAVVAWSDTRDAEPLTNTQDIYMRTMVPRGGLGDL